MRAVMRWLWVVILVLGLISLVFGVVYIIQANSLKCEALDAYGRYERLGFPGEPIRSFTDIEDKMNDFKSKRQLYEDEAEGYTTEQDIINDNPRPEGVPVSANTVVGLYLKQYPQGADPDVRADRAAMYAASTDGMTAYGLGMMMSGMYKDLMFTGILNIIIGVALILVAIVIFGIGRGIRQMGAGLSAIAATVFPPKKAE